MPRFDTTFITARYPGTAVDGTRVRKGDTIAWCSRTRRVLTADPAKIEQIRCDQRADAHDMAWEDDCARRCGL